MDLTAGERVLAAAQQVDGTWLAGTETALVGAGLRLEWALVAHAQWIDDDHELVIDPVPGSFSARRFRLASPGRLPETVHERVMTSIVVSRQVAAPGVGGIRVVGRRRTSSESLTWQVIPDRGTDADHPDVRRLADETVSRLRAELDD